MKVTAHFVVYVTLFDVQHLFCAHRCSTIPFVLSFTCSLSLVHFQNVSTLIFDLATTLY